MMLEEHAVFGILDGHGGDYASKFVKEHFYSVFCKQSEYHDYCDLFLDVHPLFDDDQEIRTKKERTSMSKNTVNADKKRKKITEEEFCTRSVQLLELALEKTFVQLDCLMLLSMKELQELKKETEPSKGWKMTENGYDLMDTGTAVLIVLITPHLIICANAGDCRAVLLCRGNNDKNCCDKKCAVKEHDKIEMNDFEVIPLSVDHKPYLPLEEERIIKAGASVSGGKIDGILSLSRALGDFNFKAQNKILETVITKSTCSESHLHTPQALANYRDLAIASAEHVVSQSPEITIKKRDNGKDLYLIGASDGIWDVVSNEECADIVSSVFKEGESDMGLVTEEIIDICLKKGSRDNMTVLVVKFPLQKIGCGGGVLKRRKRRQEIRLGTM